MLRKTYDLTGVVQGIGLRPTLHRLAEESELGGSAQNRSGVVRLVLEGEADRIAGFVSSLQTAFPRAGRLDAVTEIATEVIDRPSGRFRILASGSDNHTVVQIPPDLRMCDDCRREVFDPHDRRYGYPFTTCTLCGPRYTVVERMPYDRERTTLKEFPLCPACRKEYTNVGDRRFHAESIACPTCGPRVWFEEPALEPESSSGRALATARARLAEGRIVAIRGIGGFLLAADARNARTVYDLRQRKARPHKPFAVMADSIETVHRLCQVDAQAEDLLSSSAGPIVILSKKRDIREQDKDVFALAAPDTDTLGVMLPTSPLHELLLRPLNGDPTPPFDLLIMTSGNSRGEPICISCDEARRRLNGVADCYLMHDREINLRNDDSVCVIRKRAPQVWRRARGYAPGAVPLRRRLDHAVLALGAEMKNAIAVGDGDEVVLSPHIGDLDTPEALAGLRRVTEELPRYLGITPATVAVDLHPDMQSTRLGETIAANGGLPVVRVQHHYAHAAACLAENGEEGGLALCFDGTGYGTDGAVWGAELLDVFAGGYKRLGTFAPVPLPGGDIAVRQPVRQLAGRCASYGIPYQREWEHSIGLNEDNFNAWGKQSESGLNSPLTHAAGRVFDAFAVMIGASGPVATYDGQAAVRLEAVAKRLTRAPSAELPFTTSVSGEGHMEVDWCEAFHRSLELLAGIGPGELAMSFHQAVAAAAVEMLRYALQMSTSRVVALTGGCFMNELLTNRLCELIKSIGVKVVLHRSTPPGDGCVALGQAVVAGVATS